MDFRQTAFWQGIQEIFPQQPAAVNMAQEAEKGSRLCSCVQFMDRLDTAARRARRNRKYAVLMLLQFTQETNRLGENGNGETGELLVYRVSSCLRASDSVCCVGGARFAILLEDLRETSALPMIIEKLNSTLAGRFRTKHAMFPRCRHNLGASVFPVEGMPPGQVWLDTEAALEQAMADGPGRYLISPMVTGQTAMDDLSRELYKAYRNDEFEVVYQPVVDLDDRRILAVEGLMRWRHPVRGCLYPETFLPLLEESGLIVPVGEKLLSLLCKTGRTLISPRHASIRICINVSFRQLADRGFLLSVFDALYETRLPPQSLQLEFRESALTRDTGLAQRILPELNNAGVKLAVDSFGTGDTPLAELVRLPISLIKLDHALVSRLPDDMMVQTLVSGVGALARATGKALAAVGVEQPGQGRVLRKLMCREAQGSYYFRPLPGSELPALLDA
jgi:EAL domain-containing protein (putative c-di-GMP-specific phosphodiesterase class I)/GGDEF domain-containing protein